MMYLFGKPENLTEQNCAEVLANAKKAVTPFAAIPIATILEVLDSFGKKWLPGSPYFEEAKRGLLKEVSFTEATIHETLSIIPVLLSRSELEKKIKSELGSLDTLDGFTPMPSFDGSVRMISLGTLLHVSAGNIFLGCIDSLLMGFLTKNVSILKTSSKNNFFPFYFAQCLAEHDQNRILSDKFCIVHWKGGHSPIEKTIKSSVKGILAWGGEDMLKNYRHDLAPGVKLFEYGPKISIQVVSRASTESQSLTTIAKGVSKDILIWDQNACASPQNLFIEDGVDAHALMAAIAEELENTTSPRGKIDSNEAVEILKEEYRAKYSALLSNGALLKGKDYLLHLDPAPFLRPSPLNRTLILKRFKDLSDLRAQLEPFSFYLQSCSYALSKEEKPSYLLALAQAGMKRFAPIGTIMNGMTGAPHDGRYGLRELLQMIPDESPAIGLKEDQLNGYMFASGGTTGNPKYSHFSKSEFNLVTDLIAQNYRAQGLKPGMISANLFAAGQLWSSFLATDKALEKCDAVQLPIGMNSDTHKTLEYLVRFKVEVLLGIPSFLLELARAAQNAGIEYQPKLIFYAGENLNQNARAFLESVWAPEYIGTGGYASVDAGMIAYHCRESKPGEHHVFSQHVKLEIENEEGYVTSFYRTSQNVVHYPTGDRMRWVDEPCACGSKDAKFLLLGRIDSQMNVFGCRFLLQDIEKSLSETATPTEIFQVQIHSNPEDQVALTLEVNPGLRIDTAALVKKIYENATDVNKTISEDDFSKKFSIKTTAPGTIHRNERTGKVKPIIDRRA